MPYPKFELNKITKANISALHNVLNTMEYHIMEDELKEKKVGPSADDAIRKFQTEKGLPITGKLDDETIKALNPELIDVYHTCNKTRPKKLHELLGRVNQVLLHFH